MSLGRSWLGILDRCESGATAGAFYLRDFPTCRMNIIF